MSVMEDFPEKNKHSKTAVINCLEDLGCCSRCIVRFLEEKHPEENPKPFLNANNFLMEITGFKDVVSEPSIKRRRDNLCRTCLGILEDSTIEKYLGSLSLDAMSKYKYSDYHLLISLPKTILLRERSLLLYLRDCFPDTYHKCENPESLKKIFRLISSEQFSKKLNKTYMPNSPFKINMNINYGNDEVEVKNMEKLSKKNVSRVSIEGIIATCTDEAFKMHFPVPPSIPDTETTLDVTFSADTVYIGGRYLKFSREMGQSPWIINNKQMTEFCIQDVIFDSVVKILGFDRNKMTFSASGREDADVRMLGNGRPFYIQIQDPLTDQITFEQLREIEDDILKSGIAAVVNMQKVDQSSIKKIKDGEEFKKKHYFALCKTLAPDVDSVIEVINSYGKEKFEIHQKTPMRVLHRRTLAVRDRVIHSLRATSVPGHSDLIYVDLITQAGTYVKEFVNGDFHRTEPNLSSITGYPVDVVALDVTGVELDWP
ncbi:unnamed protein product [Phaedon cochleariae]|uniref:tRNA pseudouridine(55) synthase n=1 Tax=Phaedon cochleariae TaxID=80249 RepID=A0A9P0DHE5_PHACE|nr:unnamed protein product [Phaedon cochleariae]